MKLKTAVAATTVLAAAFLIGSAVVAGEDNHERGYSNHGESHGGHRGRHGPEMLFGGKFLQRLDLSPEQQDAVEDVMEAAKPAMHDMHTARRDSHKRLMAITPDDANYAAIVDEVAQENAEIAARTTRLAAQMQADVWALLTDEQKAQALELRAEREQRRAEHKTERAERRQAE